MLGQLLKCASIVGAVLLAGSSVPMAQESAGRQAGQAQSAMKGLSEAEFITMMIKHHRGGIEMAELEQHQGASPEVKALASKIRQAQERDIAELEKHAQHAGHTPQGTSGREAHDKMMEQQSRATMKKLSAQSGEALDRAFLDEMAKHHQMAIDMSESAKLQTPDVKQLAQKMAQAQRQEIAEIRKLLAKQPAK